MRSNKSLTAMLLDLQKAGLHDIMFRNAGVGLLFYEGPPISLALHDDSWRRYLVVQKYYRTFGEAVRAEWMRHFRPVGTPPDTSGEGKP